MKDFLYQYCIGFLDERAEDLDVIREWPPIYLVDGQPIPFEQVLLSLAKRDKVANPGLFENKDATGEDSIHFQQLRAYSLACKLAKHRAELTKDAQLRIAVIGAGFSGLTAAITLLQQCDYVQVTVFEHHRDLLPRFEGSYGRRVYPYHHLHAPADGTRPRDGHSMQWDCGLYGDGAQETGGIPGVLSWIPGTIDSVADQVRTQAKTEFEKHGKRVTVRYQTKVTDIHAVDDAGATLQWVSYTDVQVRPKASDQVSIDDELDTVEQFHAVIIAPGGSRDSVSLAGQSNGEYWNPLRVRTAAPLAAHYNVAIIGSGNTAASEVFNYLLHDHNFVSLLSALQAWQIDEQVGHSMRELLDKQYTMPLTEAAFNSYLTGPAWEDVKAVFNERLVAGGVVASREFLQLTMFVRNSPTLFGEMNSINRFLVHFLLRMGCIEIRDLYKKFKLPLNRSAESVYRIKIVDRAVELRVPQKGKIEPTGGGVWSYVCNCTGTTRTYQDVFQHADSPDFGAFFTVKGEIVAKTFKSMLIEKQDWIKAQRSAARSAQSVEASKESAVSS